jgi:hypothetical protein
MSNDVTNPPAAPEPTPPVQPPASPPPAAAQPPAPAPPQAPTSPPTARKKSGCFLRLFVLLVVLLLVIGGLLAGVQWALQNTDYARNIALPIVERQLGLRLSAKSLRVSLLGHTELTDVDVGLPLDPKNFLHVDALRVKHANLLQIIIDRAVTLDDVEIDRPRVDVIQDANGQWNLLQVADILGRLGGSNSAQPTTTSGGVPKLPAVHLVDGTLNIDDGRGHHADVGPLNVVGQPKDLLVWTYNVKAGPAGAELLTVDGVVAPGGSWKHEVKVTLGHLDPLAKAFGVDSTYAASVLATWDGALTDGKVGGRLSLDQVSATRVPTLGDVSVTGAIDVATGGGSAAPAGAAAVAAGPTPLVTLSPNHLLVSITNKAMSDLGVTAGAITYDSAGVHARGLKVTAFGGAASLDATADPKTQNVDATARWTGLTVAAGISQAGSLTASVRQPFPGKPVIRVELDDQGSIGTNPAPGSTAGTRWDAAVQLTGQGSSWTSVDWVLAVPRLRVLNGGTNYDLSGLTAQVQQRPTTIDLLGLTLPPAAVTGTAAAPAAAVASGESDSARATTAEAAAARATAPTAATATGGSPFGLTFATSAHVTLPDATATPKRPLSWTLNLGAGLTGNYQGTPIPVTLALDAEGDADVYKLKKLAVSAADANMVVDGQYASSQPEPVSLHVKLTQTPRLTPDAPVQGTFGGEFNVVGLLFDYDPLDDAIEAAAAADVPPAGPTTAPAAATMPATHPTTAAAVAIASTTAPSTEVPSGPTVPHHLRPHPSLTVTGNLRTSELVVFGKPIGDIGIALAGDVRSLHPPKTANGPAAANALPAHSRVHVDLHSTDFTLFQARWKLDVAYPNPTDAAELNLSTSQLPLDVLVKVATGGTSSPVTGQLTTAHWRLTAAGLGLGDVNLASEYRLDNVNVAGSLPVDSVDAQASFHDGSFHLGPVTARSGTGTTDVAVDYALRTPNVIHTHVVVNQWPYPLGSALGGPTEARANAQVDLDVNLPTQSMAAGTAATPVTGAMVAAPAPTAAAASAGPAPLAGGIQAAGSASTDVDVILHPTVVGRSIPQVLAHASVKAKIQGRVLTLTEVAGRLLNGKFDGQFQADVDKPLEAAGRLQWQDIDAGALGPLTGNKALDDLHGKFSGTVTVAPSRDPRSLEPVRIDVNVASSDDARFRSVRLGDDERLLMAHAVAYANIDRAVLDHSDIYMAGGIVHLWGRVGRALSSQSVILEYAGLKLDQLAHMAPAQCTGPVPGTVDGTVRAVRSGPELAALIGGGHADIVNADLVNLKAVGTLYQLLNADHGDLQPVGQGSADFALEAGTLRLTNFGFYNRGVDAHGLLTVGPVDTVDAMNTRLVGNVVGTLRYLKNSKLSFLSDFDDTLATIEGGLTNVNIRGTLANPDIKPGSLDDIGSGLQELLVGDARQQQQP